MRPRYPILPPLRCAYVFLDTLNDGTEQPRLCWQAPLDHLHEPADTCDNAPERHHAYQRPKRHRHAT